MLKDSPCTTIGEGDKSQLKYIKDRYNFLLYQATNVEDDIEGRLKENLPCSAHIRSLNKMLEEMIALDDIRTSMIAGRMKEVIRNPIVQSNRLRPIWEVNVNSFKKPIKIRKPYGKKIIRPVIERKKPTITEM